MKYIETNSLVLVVGVALLAFIGTYFTMIVPLMDDSLNTPSEHAKPYTDLELQGKEIYGRDGCWYCHTQQNRNLLVETKRYGMGEEETFKRFGVRTLVQAPPSQPGEFAYDKPHLLGTRRIGPDLARVGGKYDNSWHINHLRDPSSTSPGSIMPKISWFFDKSGQPKQEAIAMVAYLQKLGTNIPWREDGLRNALRMKDPEQEMDRDKPASPEGEEVES